MSNINGLEISRFGVGTKRMPTEDSSRVIHLDTAKAEGVLDTAIAGQVNFVETSYSNHKGEAEAFLGEYASSKGAGLRFCTGFFEMIDPRFEYVFQKQLKKLGRDSIDLYYVEGITDRNKEVNIDSGAIDYLFDQKEMGHIAQIGFSSELSASNLKEFAARYPWDFVRMRINYFDWFEGDAKDTYETAVDAGLPVIAHGALRMGPAGRIKDEALAILKDANPARSSADWALRFVKSLEGVKSVTTNVYSADQLKDDMAVFDDNASLDDGELDVLRSAAAAQRTVRPTAAKMP